MSDFKNFFPLNEKQLREVQAGHEYHSPVWTKMSLGKKPNADKCHISAKNQLRYQHSHYTKSNKKCVFWFYFERMSSSSPVSI